MKKNLKFGIGILTMYALITTSTCGVLAAKGADGNTYNKQSCEYGYNINLWDVGLPGHKKLQSIAFNNGKLYATVRYDAPADIEKSVSNSDDSIKDDMAIVEFELDTKNYQANYSGHKMIIVDGGHGETLDVHNGVFMIGVRAKDDSKKDGSKITDHGDQFAQQIAFTKFEDKCVYYTGLPNRITNIQHIGGSSKSRGTVERVAASCSDNKVYIRAQISGKYYYAKYDINTVWNKAVDAKKAKCLGFKEAGKCTGWGSFQSMECRDGSMYISSGFHSGEAPRIGRYTLSDKNALTFKKGIFLDQTFTSYLTDRVSYGQGGVFLGAIGEGNFQLDIPLKNCETQGLSFSGDKLYLLLSYKYSYGQKNDCQTYFIVSTNQF